MLYGVWAIYKRELRVFFTSAGTYVAVAMMFLILGLIFHQMIEEFVDQSAFAAAGGPFNTSEEPPNVTVDVIEQIFLLIVWILLFTVPVLTMRMIAAERSEGTFELIVTCPVSDWGLLLGKYMALLTVGLCIISLFSVYPLTTYYLGRGQGVAPESAVVWACFAGIFLIFCTYAAFGLMASSFTESQVIAAVLTIIGLLLWNALAEFHMPNEILQRIVDELSAARHTEEFIKGRLSTTDFAFFALTSFACLFVAARRLEARRWKV